MILALRFAQQGESVTNGVVTDTILRRPLCQRQDTAPVLSETMRMKRLSELALSLGVMLVACTGGAQRPSDLTRHTVALTQTVRIPAEALTPDSKPGADARLLLMSPGGPDELPRGPEGFDVTKDGNYLIADPLRRRIAVFRPDGGYLSEWPAGFAVDSITIAPDESVQIREASTGEIHVFDLKGVEHPGPAAAIPMAQALLAGSNRGFVDRLKGGPLEIRFEKPGLTLISLQAVSTDPPGDTYVAVEATPGGDTVEISKFIRRYSADSRLLAETSSLPLDYYVRPVNEIRVRKDVVYQLMTASSEVRINIWDMKP
jgi:hypothetical protein